MEAVQFTSRLTTDEAGTQNTTGHRGPSVEPQIELARAGNGLQLILDALGGPIHLSPSRSPLFTMVDPTFLAEIETAITAYERVIGHYASRTRNMISEHGHIKALSRLVVSADLQQGFKALRDRGQLDITFEAVVVRHPHLFDTEAVEAAQWRLDNAHALLD